MGADPTRPPAAATLSVKGRDEAAAPFLLLPVDDGLHSAARVLLTP
jgi:hypothetical protein